LGGRVRQYHEADSAGAFEEYVLGVYQLPSSTGTVHHFAGGDVCPSSQDRRSAEVRLNCLEAAEHSGLRLVKVSEPAVCHYLLELRAPQRYCQKLPPIRAAPVQHEQPTAALPPKVDGTTGPLAKDVWSLPTSGAEEIPSKRAAVVAALAHAWRGYEQYAFGADELKPVSKGRNDWVGLGLTILDSLDVLWMAGLRKEYKDGVEWIRNHLNFDKPRMISFFETTIRCLGGLLAAYELSGDAVLLEKATDLGERLLKAFSSPSGLPYPSISLSTGAHSMASWTGGNLLLAEVGTVQMEFSSLAHHTGRAEFATKSHHVIDVLDSEGGATRNGGRLWPIHVRPETGRPSGETISWGAMGDSYYEYLLKMWLLTGKRNPQYKRMYLETIVGLQQQLVVSSQGLTYVAEKARGQVARKMDHLVCFLPGTIALGAQHLPEQHDEHMELAAKLIETCYQMYARQRTGLAPEYVRFQGDMTIGAAHNLLRPETVESLFYMWRFTHDPKYREWGWRIFTAFERHCRVSTGGYAGLKNVNVDTSAKDDTMQTFWLAETLKYFLLLFSDDEALSLTENVINTEAHPLAVIPEGSAGDVRT